MAEHAHTIPMPHAGTASATKRRSLFGAVTALACAPAVLLAPPAAISAVPNPDAGLIEACREYLVALDAYEACTGWTDEKLDPLWEYMERMEARVESIPPITMAGVVALAEVAVHWSRQPDGTEDFATSFTGDWPERVTRAVLRIAGGQA